MTLQQIGWLVGEFTGTDKYAEELVTLLNFAQEQYFAANIDNEAVVYPFIKHKGVDNGTMPLVVSSTGIASLPSDFARHKDITFIYDGVQQPVEVLTAAEFDDRKSSSIEIPTRQYPIASYYGAYIKFLPRNLQFVNYTYLSKPADTVYATKQENGMEVYDAANSTELAWAEADQVEIVRILLQEVGVAVTAEQIKEKLNNTSK